MALENVPHEPPTPAQAEIDYAARNDVVGPCKIRCENECEVPPGVTLTPVPRPRHVWADVIACPNCPLAFLVNKPEMNMAMKIQCELEYVPAHEPGTQDRFCLRVGGMVIFESPDDALNDEERRIVNRILRAHVKMITPAIQEPPL